MVTAVKLNGNPLQHKDGLVYVDNSNETLDSGVIVCEGIDRLEIEPLDELDITFPNNTTKRMLVSSYNESVASYTPRKYDYQIQYVSPTLLTERITLPNLAITTIYADDYYLNDRTFGNYAIKNGEYYSRSVATYIDRYLSEYANFDYEIDEELIRIASLKICPEMSFSRPTLREVLQSLLEVVDLIFALDFNYATNRYVITFIDPNKTNNQIEVEFLDTDTISNTANQYVTSLDVELENAINDEVVKSIPYLTARTSDAIMTTNNAELFVGSPIYSIKKLEIHLGLTNFYSLSNGALENLQWVDITDYVVEKSVYEALEVGDPLTDPTPSSLKKFNSLYFKQGDNVISGLSYTTQILNLFDDPHNALFYIVKNVIEKNYPAYAEYMEYVESGFIVWEDFLMHLFRLEYTTQQDVKMQTERTKKLKHQSTLFDSQENQYVNVNAYSKHSLSTLNRLSNNERTITAVYDNFNDIPRLNDYIDDYILVNREISIYDNYCVFKGILTKDYGNKYQFNAIDSKKRFYNISSEKITRHELLKRYYIFSYENDAETDIVQANKILRWNYLNSDYIIFKNLFGGLEFALECNNYRSGNSVLTTFGVDDNIIIGNTLSTNKTTGGYLQRPLEYGNDYGESTGYEFYGFTGYTRNLNFGSPAQYEDFYKYVASKHPYVAETFEEAPDYQKTNLKPIEEAKFSITSNHIKDQREVLRWTIQHCIVSDENDIVLGELFYELLSHSGSVISLMDTSVIDVENDYFNTRKNDIIDAQYRILADNSRDLVTITDNYMTINASGNIGIIYQGRLIIGVNNYVANTPIYVNVSDKR